MLTKESNEPTNMQSTKSEVSYMDLNIKVKEQVENYQRTEWKLEWAPEWGGRVRAGYQHLLSS